MTTLRPGAAASAAFDVSVVDLRFLVGCTAGLAEKTALVDLAVSGAVRIDDAAERRLRTAALALCPEQPPTDLPPDAAPAGEDMHRLGQWVVALTVAVERWAREPAGWGRVVGTEPGRLMLALPWYRQQFFDEALTLALEVIRRAVTAAGGAPLHLATHFGDRWEGTLDGGLPPTTLRFVQAGQARGMPFDILPTFVQIGWGVNAERLDMAFTGHTSWMANALACDKWKSKCTLAGQAIPTPRGWLVSDVEEAVRIAAEVTGWPVVVKPVSGDLGRGVATGIADPDALRQAFADTARHGAVLLEEHLAGDDHCLLVVGGRFLAAVRCVPGDDGGAAQDVTDSVHPDNRALAERVARTVGLDIAGVDLITVDLSRSWREVGGAVLEVNGQPGFRPYSVGDPDRDIYGEVLDILFAGRPARIPTAAITGTNGKTTTATMLHHLWTTAGYRTGLCTTAQLLIGDEVVTNRNLSGQPGAQLLLNDPGVQAAVLEMPRKGLLMFGHPCDRYDVAALTNIQDDHIGVDGIETLDQMAELKAEVLERARVAVVVNADDPRCMTVRHRAGTDRHILVTEHPETVAGHRRAGGEAVYPRTVDGRPSIVLAAGEREDVLIAVDDIPATMAGLLRFNVINAMFAAALAHAQGIDIDTLRHGLRTFDNTLHNPGRYNLVDGFDFQVLLDYGHNPDGLADVWTLVRTLPVSGRRLVCLSQIGNRHPEHFTELAPVLAGLFDGFVVGCEPDTIRTADSYPGDDPVDTMLARGRRLLIDAGVTAAQITTEAVPGRAVRTALLAAAPGDLVVLLVDHTFALPVIEELLREGDADQCPVNSSIELYTPTRRR